MGWPGLHRSFCLLFFCVFFPATVLAFGPHQKLQCADCHAIHTAKSAKNKIEPVSATEKDSGGHYIFEGVMSSCLACHKTGVKGKAGIGSVCAIHAGLPGAGDYPGESSGRLSVPHSSNHEEIGCGRCHDPHRTNPNYKYLIVATKKGKNLRKFCVTCHYPKTDRIAEQSVSSLKVEQGYAR